MHERVWRMLVKEFIQTFRDPRMRVVVFVLPVIQMMVIGYAVTTDVRNVRTAVFDRDRSPSSRELVARFLGSGYFRLVESVESDARAGWLIDHGRVDLVLRLNHGFDEDLRAGRTAPVQLIVDGTDSNTAAIIQSYANKILLDFSRQQLIERFVRLQGPLQKPGRVELRSRAWFNENLESRHFYIPGVIVIVVSVVTLTLTSMAVVREKEIGTIEQVMVTPIRPAEFILGKTAPFALIALADVAIVSAVGVFWFQVPIRGSLGLLFLSAAVYLVSMLAMGLLIATISHTQQQVMMGVFFVFFPAVLLSGFMFPIANMPVPVQWLTYVNPLRYFLVMLRGVFLKGVGLDILWPQLAAMGAIGLGTLALATSRFRKTL